MLKKLVRLVQNTRGGEFIEYAVICGVVALLAITAFTTFGTDVQNKITEEGGKVTGISD